MQECSVRVLLQPIYTGELSKKPSISSVQVKTKKEQQKTTKKQKQKQKNARRQRELEISNFIISNYNLKHPIIPNSTVF